MGYGAGAIDPTMKAVLDYAFFCWVRLMRRAKTSPDDLYLRAAGLMCIVFGWWFLGILVLITCQSQILPANINRFVISIPLVLAVGTFSYRYYLRNARADLIEKRFTDSPASVTIRILSISFLVGPFLLAFVLGQTFQLPCW